LPFLVGFQQRLYDLLVTAHLRRAQPGDVDMLALCDWTERLVRLATASATPLSGGVKLLPVSGAPCQRPCFMPC
jgi:hypothetical protein